MISLKRIISNYLVSGALLSQTRLQSFCPSSMSTNEFLVVYVTAPNDTVAKTIAQKLVEDKLAACVNLIPGITSIYEWKGKIETDSEVLLMIKTRTSRIEQLTNTVKANHPYEVCEVIAVPIQEGNDAYLKWLGETVPHK